jgi:hypothetical protein
MYCTHTFSTPVFFKLHCVFLHVFLHVFLYVFLSFCLSVFCIVLCMYVCMHVYVCVSECEGVALMALISRGVRSRSNIRTGPTATFVEIADTSGGSPGNGTQIANQD